MCVGIVLGAAVGACIEENPGSSIAVGMCLGMTLGIAADIVVGKIKKNKMQNSDQEETRV